MIRRDGGRAFFIQQRIGKNGHPFYCYKFRSMREDAETFLQSYLATHPIEAQQWRKYQKLRNDVRVTPFGRFLRRFSLDELPQFINVLKGDMSIVGPRPILPDQIMHYGEKFSCYASMRPGITGPWQVGGRNALTFSERVKLEAQYACNWSLTADWLILLKTMPVVLKKRHAF